MNRAYQVEELFRACHDYFRKTGRRISFEYAMIDGVNDHDWQADLIASRIRGMPGHVNLIPLNDVVESPFKPSGRIRRVPAESWNPMASPPRCGEVWVEILTLPADSSAGRPWKKPREERSPYDARMGNH